MKTIMFTTGLVLVLAGSTAANAGYYNYDMERTNTCYEAAAMQRADQETISNCTMALTSEATTAGQLRAATFVNRGILFSLRKQNAAAMQDFNSALQIDPQQAEAWLGKALQTWVSGDDRDAIGYANQALALGTHKVAVAYLVRGLANEGVGNLRAAYADLVTARDMAPGWSEPAQELSRYRIVQR